MNKCSQCESTSVIQDGQIWVCADHINLCQCKKNHQAVMDWDFNQSRLSADGYTIEAMESQVPDIRLEGFYKRTNVQPLVYPWGYSTK